MIKGRLGLFACSLAAVILFALGSRSFADLKGSDGYELYLAQRYEDAQRSFESDLDRTWRDPNLARYYAYTLVALGKTPDAIKICERIIKVYPGSKAAKEARANILDWKQQTAWNSVGDFGILGLKFKIADGGATEVKAIYSNTPAETAHLQVGDIITAIDGVPTTGLTENEIYNMLVGGPETRVTLDIKRSNAHLVKVLTRMHSKSFARTHPDIWKKYF